MALAKSKITEMIDAYLTAEISLLNGKTITFQGETCTSEDLDKIRAGRKEWERRLLQVETKSSHSLANFN